MIWLDIERYQWSPNLDANRNFISAMINELRSLGKHGGIYTNYYNWQVGKLFSFSRRFNSFL
jgi:hypothetical protein